MTTYTYNSPYGSKYTVVVNTSRKYGNGRKSIQLVDAEDGSPILTASVNIPNAELSENEICIKNWSENEGVLAFLQRNKIVGATKRYVPTGFVRAEVCDLLIS